MLENRVLFHVTTVLEQFAAMKTFETRLHSALVVQMPVQPSFVLI